MLQAVRGSGLFETFSPGDKFHLVYLLKLTSADHPEHERQSMVAKQQKDYA